MFETETLRVARHTARYATIYDPNFSGGAATLFRQNTRWLPYL